jgi:hypothetical protein
MTRYVARGTSAFFASSLDKKPMSTLDAFREAGMRRPRAAEAWLKRLAQVTCQDVQAIFVQIPPDRISTVATEFALTILALNYQRLLTL